MVLYCRKDKRISCDIKKSTLDNVETVCGGTICFGVDNASFKFAEGMKASEAVSPAI